MVKDKERVTKVGFRKLQKAELFALLVVLFLLFGFTFSCGSDEPASMLDGCTEQLPLLVGICPAGTSPILHANASGTCTAESDFYDPEGKLAGKCLERDSCSFVCEVLPEELRKCDAGIEQITKDAIVCRTPGVCGNGTCEVGESAVNCSSDCLADECSSGPCCDDRGRFMPATTMCGRDQQERYICPWGETCGSSVGLQSSDRFCSGTSAMCDGEFGDWKPHVEVDKCDNRQHCTPGIANCVQAQTQDYKGCYANNVYWYDSCGVRATGDPTEICDTAQGCLDGACRICSSHETKACYGGDVFFFDSCGRPEEKVVDCGLAPCLDATATSEVRCNECLPTSNLTCFNGSLYTIDSCGAPTVLAQQCSCGCADNACLSCYYRTPACPTYSITASRTCSELTGGVNLEVCGDVDIVTGAVTLRVRKPDRTYLRAGTYQVLRWPAPNIFVEPCTPGNNDMVFEGVVAADNTDAALEIELSETLTVGEVAYYCVYRVNSQSDDGCSGQLQVWRE